MKETDLHQRFLRKGDLRSILYRERAIRAPSTLKRVVG
jgi:hypothetical protein